jgi:hypothetical protein
VHVGAEVDASALARFQRIVYDADALAMQRCVQIIRAWNFIKWLKGLDWHAVAYFARNSDQDMAATGGWEKVDREFACSCVVQHV